MNTSQASINEIKSRFGKCPDCENRKGMSNIETDGMYYFCTGCGQIVWVDEND